MRSAPNSEARGQYQKSNRCHTRRTGFRNRCRIEGHDNIMSPIAEAEGEITLPNIVGKATERDLKDTIQGLARSETDAARSCDDAPCVTQGVGEVGDWTGAAREGEGPQVE